MEKRNGNYCSILQLYRDNGKENGNWLIFLAASMPCPHLRQCARDEMRTVYPAGRNAQRWRAQWYVLLPAAAVVQLQKTSMEQD